MALLAKPDECRSCALYGNGMGFSRPEGLGTLGVACFAEALGEEEERDALPLRPYAQSGSMFQRILKMCGYDRAMFTLYNVVNCRPKNNWLDGAPWESSAINHCRVHRERVIDAVKPRVIIALGGVALRTLTGESGEKRGVSYLRGYILPALKGYGERTTDCPDCADRPKNGCFLCDGSGKLKESVPVYRDIYVMPTFHPSFIQRGEKRMIGVVVHDIKKAVELSQQLLHGKKPERKPVAYQTQPSLDEARSFEFRCQENQGSLVTYDIETPSSASEDEDLREIGTDDDDDKPKKYPQDYALSDEESTIIQAQFSLGPYTGIAFPWQGEYIAIAKRILAMRHRKAGWNSSTFDDPRLRAAGCVLNGPLEDFMWKWHHLQPDLPAGLQFACSFLGMDFPWKHLYSESLDWYGCADVDAPQRADQPLTDALKKLGISRGYEQHIVALTPILQTAADRGVPVNREKLAAFDTKIAIAQEEVRSTKIMPKVEGLGLGKIEPKDGLKTASTPELKKLLLTMTPIEIATVRLSHVDAKGKESFYRFEQREFPAEKASKTVDVMQLDFMTAVEAPSAMIIRWCRHFEFNPNSPDQLKNYMKAKKHPIPKDFKTEAETTNKQELVRLANKTKDSFYTEIIEFREFSKMRATYCKGWLPKADGCVHTTWTFRPATGQLSSVSPNIQNCFSDDTEVLTARGWIGFPELLSDDLVAQWANYSTLGGRQGLIEFAKPEQIVHYDDEKFLQHITTDEQIDLLITSEHECLLQHRKTLQVARFRAAEYPKEFRQLQAGWYLGGDVHLTEEQVTLICALQADGHVMKAYQDKKGRSRGQGGHYDFSLYKPRKIKRLEQALQILNIPYRKYDRPIATSPAQKLAGVRFYISRKDIPAWWLDRKVFGPWVLDLTRESLDYLSEEIWFWDGCYSRRSAYSSSVKQNSNWAQIVTLLSNRRAKLRLYPGDGNRGDNWQVDASQHHYSLTSNHTNQRVSYSGRVHCVTMPWGTVIVRRNGLVAITGNSPKHSELAKEFRDCIEAPPGHHIVEFDYKSFHALTLGFEAKDPDYMRLARLDIHSYVAAHLAHLPERDSLLQLGDDELRDRLARIKHDHKFLRDKKAKPTILGYGFGLGYRKLYQMNRESFTGEKDAKALIDLLDGLFPRTCRFREDIKHQAQREYRLLSRHGYHRRFYDVLVYWGMGKIEDAVRRGWKVPAMCPICKQRHDNGEEAEAAVAFLPANDAFGHIKDSAIRLDEQGWLKRAGFINTIHDSLMFLMPDSLVDEAIPAIHAEMTKPSEVLIDPTIAPEGLVCDVEVSVGQTWRNLEAVSLATGMAV